MLDEGREEAGRAGHADGGTRPLHGLDLALAFTPTRSTPSLLSHLPPMLSPRSRARALTRAQVTAPDGEKMNSVIKVERKLGLKASDEGRGRKAGAAAGGGGKGRAPPPQKQRKKKKARPFYQDSSSSSADGESEDEDDEDRHTQGVVELTDDETDDETLDDNNNHYNNGGGGGSGGGGEGAAANQLGRSPSGSRPCAAALPTNAHPTTAWP